MAYSPHRALAIVPRVAMAAAASTAWASLSGASPPKLLKGPYLTGLSESSVEVRFEAAGPSVAAVDLRFDAPDGGVSRTFEDRASTTMHTIRLGGLEATSRYAYVVRLGGAQVGTGRFKTAPKRDSGESLTFLVYGDNRTDPVAHAAVVRALVASPSDFLVNTGDLVEDGTRPEDWQTFFDVEAPLIRDRALFVAIGNHELFQDSAGANFARYFGFNDAPGAEQIFATVRLSNARFFFLNAMHDWASGDERQWLERALGQADGEPGLVWRIGVIHQGPWSSGPHGANASFVAARVPELLEAHNVDLLLSGHDHIYERGVGGALKYIVSGGGGAPLYRIARRVPSSRNAESTYHFVEVSTGADSIRVVARRIDGSLLERCGFAKGRPWDCDGPSDTAPSPAPVNRPQPAAPSSSARCGCIAAGVQSSDAEALLPAWVGAIAAAWARRSRRASALAGQPSRCVHSSRTAGLL